MMISVKCIENNKKMKVTKREKERVRTYGN